MCRYDMFVCTNNDDLLTLTRFTVLHARENMKPEFVYYTNGRLNH